VTKSVQYQVKGGTLTLVLEPESHAAVYFTIRYRDFTITARGKDMAYILAVATQAHVQVSYIDAGGNPAEVDGEVSWSSSDDTIATVTVDSADSAKALVRAVGAIGQVQISATADADLGEGTREIITPMDVEVVAGEAVAGTITPVGGAEPIPQVEHRRR
jgi:Big-like domain-containing protein